MFSIIKPRGDIKTNWESVNPVLRLREWGIEWEETVGTGDIKVKIGDGVKHWNELDYAIVNDVTKKIVKTFAEVNSDDNPNPILNPGESIDALFGKIKQKFEYATNFMTSLKNMVGDYQARSFNTGSGTVTADDLKSAIDILEQYKLTTANILDVNDSTNTFAALSANQGRLINEKAVANANAISTLNSNLGAMTFHCERTSGNFGTLILNSEKEDPSSCEGSQITMYGKGGNAGTIFNIDCFDNVLRIFYTINEQLIVYNFKPDGIYINNERINSFTQAIYSGDIYQLAPGAYYCTPSVLNLPKDNIYFFVEIFNWENGKEKIIRATSTNEPNARHVYTNFFSGGNWQGWLMLA